jgi:hypothetical protein
MEEETKIEEGNMSLENERIWKDLFVKYLQGSKSAKDVLKTRLWPYIATGDERIYKSIMSRFYKVVGLQSVFETKAGDKLSPRDLEKVFVVLEKHPFADSKEISKSVVLADLGIVKTEKDFGSERVKKLLEEYEEWKKMEKRRDILDALGYAFLPITVLDLLLLRGKRLSPKAEMGMGFLGIAQMIVGGLNAIRRLPDTEYHLEELSPIWRLINGFIALRGMARVFKGFRNPAFKWEIAKTKVWNPERVQDNLVAWEVSAIGRVENLLHSQKSIIEAARRNPPTLQDKINLMKLDYELPGMKYYIGALEEYKERLDLIRGMIDNPKFLEQLIKGLETGKFPAEIDDFIEHISKSITLNTLAGTELSYRGSGKWRILRIDKQPDGSEIERVLYKDLSFKDVYNIWKNGERNIVAEYYIPTKRKTPDGKIEVKEEVVKTIPLRDKYVPLFSPSFIVKYEKDGVIKRETFDYFDMKNVIPQLEAEGARILEVSPPSFRIYETRKFARKIEEEVKQVMNYLQSKGVKIGEADLDEFLKTFHDNLGKYIDEMKKLRNVWGLERTTDLGFLGKLKDKSFDKMSAEEKLNLTREFIFDNIRRRIFPREIVYYRNLLENLQSAGLLGKEGRFMLEIARDIDRPISLLDEVSAINRKWQRLMITAHFPVRVFNTLTSLMIPIMRVFENSSLSGEMKKKIAKKMVAEMAKSLKNFSPKGAYKTAFSGAGELSAIEMVNLAFKAPFEHAVENVLERWSKVKEAGKTLLEWGFPEMGASVSEAKHLIDLIFMGSAAYGKPVFLYTTSGKALNELSAFFTANYLPFYLSARAFYRALFNHPTLWGIIGIGMTGIIYSSLLGASNLPYFDLLDKALRLGIQLWNAVGITEKIEPPDVNIPMYLLADVFGIPSNTNPVSQTLTHIMMGGGLMGWATKWRTKAGALSFPEILNSPLVEVPRRFLENVEELKKKIRTDPKNANIYMKAAFDTFAETGAILTRINNNFFDRFSSFMHEPYHKWTKYLKEEFGIPEVAGEAIDFLRATGRLIAPLEVFPPAFARIYDKATVRQMRESGVESLAYFYSSIERGLRRGGNLNQLQANIEKQIDTIINKISKGKWDSEDVKNLIFLQLLRKDLVGRDAQLSEREIKKISEVFNIDERAIEEYAKKLRTHIKLSKTIAKKGIGELIKGFEEILGVQ